MEQNTLDESPQIVAKTTQQNNKTPAITCILCGILAIAGIGFGIYGMFFQPKPTCEIPGTTNTSEMVADLSVNEVKNLLNNTYKLGTREITYSNGLHKYLDNFDENAKMIQLLWLSEDVLGEPVYNDQSSTINYSVSYDSLNNRYHKLFGNSNDLEKRDYELEAIGILNVKYDAANDSFAVVYADGLGGRSSVYVFTKVINTSSIEGGVKATVAAVTIDSEPKEKWELFNGNHYNESIDGKFNVVELSSEDLDKIYESMKVYDFVFVKDDDGYKLNSIKGL